MSTSQTKRWQLLSKKKPTKPQEIIKTLALNRGLKTKKEVEEFFNPPNPYGLKAKDMGISKKEVDKAIKRIKKAISGGEKIIVYGDFDTDGVCATAVLWETLNTLGARVLPFIPTRAEGYGLKSRRIDEFGKKGVSLIMTVDQGIVANKQAAHAQKVGVDLIITDHHSLGKEKPEAEAVVHTIKLAGGGVSWFLACQLAKHFKNKKALPSLDLVTIATVADMVPLLEANRAIVKHGLGTLSRTKRIGLLKLFEAAGVEKEKINTYEVGFILGPTINASGRLDDPMEALRLLCTPSEIQASSLARKLDRQNRQRQDLTEKTYLFARELWLKNGKDKDLIFLSHESFEEGVVGLVASRLKDEFYKPAIVVSLKKDVAKGSARSITGFNVVEAIRACADLLGPHGGHPLAAGFEVDKGRVEKLSQRLQKIARESLAGLDFSPTIKIDMEIDFSALTHGLYGQILKFEPFGVDNPEPVFASYGILIKDVQLVGRDGGHLKLTVVDPKSKKSFSGLAFGLGGRFDELSSGQKIDLVYRVFVNQWGNKKRLALKLVDFRVKNEES